MSEMAATFQGRLRGLTAEQEALLADYAERYGLVERSLYADMRRASKKAASFKNAYLIRFDITARQFNAVSRNLEGKISSVLALLPLHKQETEIRIARAKKVLANLRNPSKRHQKQRRLHILETRLAAIEAQIAEKDPRICFGSRKLFRAQFDLEANGYADRDEWRADWQAKRASQFFVIGSKDENAGCQGCVLTAAPDGSFSLRLRLPGKERRYLELSALQVPYGQDVLREALRNKQAISYRFLRDAKGWRVFITTARPAFIARSLRAAGAVGVDVNADCLAVSEIDRHGNLVGSCVVPLHTYGKTSNQAKAAVGEAVKAVLEIAEAAQKPLVVEKLDFGKKKAELEKADARYARMLSSLAYNAVLGGIKSRAHRAGIEVLEINPAYTSTIGLINYTKSEGLSVHQAAAFAIARRGCGFRERPLREEACVPTPTGDHVTFSLPERNREKHVWSFWASARKTHLAVLAAHLRPSLGEPLAVNPAKGKCPRFTVQFRDANHRQHCLADVAGEIPW